MDLRDHDGCPDRALFMCWPRFGDEILAAYRGEVLIVVSSDLTWEVDEDKDGWMLERLRFRYGRACMTDCFCITNAHELGWSFDGPLFNGLPVQICKPGMLFDVLNV